MANGGALSVLLLGVTPELVSLGWPSGTRLAAFDHAFGMVSGLWRGTPAGTDGVTAVADWRALPLADNCLHLAVGDGSYNSVESIADQNRVSAEVVRLLQPRGVLALRVYARPEAAMSPGEVFDGLRRRRFRGFNAFKLRLLMAMPAAADGSIRLCDVWDAWANAGIDGAALAAETGWSIASIATIDAYRGKQARFVFLTLAEMRRELARYFVELRMVTKTYELGESCPTLVLQRR